MGRSTCFGFLLAAAAAVVAPNALAPAEIKTNPTVVELFTSQSCYSCPPAEAFLGELVAGRPDILGLEFHVDYWDELVHGGGKWKDIFSSPASTHRQRVYNLRIRGRASVYTPQMVIDGVSEAVGSNRTEVLNAVRDVGAQALAVSIDETDGVGLRVTVEGELFDEATIWFVQYLREHTTDVLRGENKGKTLTNHNVVRDFRPIGEWRGQAISLDLGDLELPAGHGCAVLVQKVEAEHSVPGPILGAGVCPPQTS